MNDNPDTPKRSLSDAGKGEWVARTAWGFLRDVIGFLLLVTFLAVLIWPAATIAIVSVGICLALMVLGIGALIEGAIGGNENE